MAYTNINRRAEQGVKQDDMLATKRFTIERKPDALYFYELEEAVVLDVIMDEEHPLYKNNMRLDAESWPPNIDGSQPNSSEKDYSWIGKIRFRFLKSQVNAEKDSLSWAKPLENTGIIEYPLMNEIVVVGKYRDEYYYTRKLNTNSTVNSNAIIYVENVAGRLGRNVNTLVGGDGKYEGPESKMNFSGGADYTGVLGSYFKFNHKIRTLRLYEGDTLIQSRFGSSIRFGAYDTNRANDNGVGEYEDGGGNPMILIRNRQAPIKSPQGYTGKGYTLEDINKDGSSVHITSGKTISGFVPQVGMPIISGKKPIKIPEFKGDQIIVNSDRLVFSSKANEMLFFSKNKIGFSTDNEFMASSAERMTFSTPKTFSVNAYQVFLGDHGKIYEPALLGKTTVLWLQKLTDAVLNLVSIQDAILKQINVHTHGTKFGPTTPPLPPALPLLIKIQTDNLTAAAGVLQGLKMKASSLQSSRVFVSGGSD